MSAKVPNPLYRNAMRIEVIQVDAEAGIACLHGVYIEGEDGDMIEVPCQWFAACDEHAATTEPHPILGDVPICEKHIAWCRRMEQ